MEPVVIAEPDPRWRDAFLSERERLTTALGEGAVRIEHIGSTAVPGLAAKPVIDVMVAVRVLGPPDRYLRHVAPLGYRHQPIGSEARLFFVKGAPRTHHLHIVKEGGEEMRRHLLFRDRLIACPQLADEYMALKRELARRFRDDRDAYVRGKSDFIAKAIEPRTVD